MLFHVRARLAIAAATLALLLAASAAQAELLAVEPAGSVTVSSLGALTFRSPFVSVTCSLTISGTLESKVLVQSAAGEATRASVSECRGATVTTDASAEAPWTIVVGAALGTLPSSLTGVQVGIYSAGFLFDIPFAGSHIRCLYKGHVGGLTRLSGTNPYRTGLIALQTTSEEFVLYRELDTTGLCPSAREVSVTGELSMTTETLTATTVPFSIDSPAIPIFYTGTEAKTITFRNTSGVMQRLRRVRLHIGTANYAIEANTCLEAGETPKVFAANATCTVRVRFTAPGDRRSRFDILDLFGDPSESILGGVGFSAVPS